MKETWPNFFIIGAPRSGTTFLYNYLNQISGIFMSSIKEPNFFAPTINHKKKLTKPIRDEKKYLKLFQYANDQTTTGEASPTYLWDPKSAKLIHEKIPDAKIIMILRDPVERAFSHYLLGVNSGYQNLPFKEVLSNSLNLPNDYSENRIVMASFYSIPLKRYFDLFPKNQLKILIFEEFIKESEKFVKEILEFLGVDAQIPDSTTIETNPTEFQLGHVSKQFIKNSIIRKIIRDVIPRRSIPKLKKTFGTKVEKPLLSSDDRKFAEGIFKEDVQMLEKLLNRKLPWMTAKNL